MIRQKICLGHKRTEIRKQVQQGQVRPYGREGTELIKNSRSNLWWRKRGVKVPVSRE